MSNYHYPQPYQPSPYQPVPVSYPGPTKPPKKRLLLALLFSCLAVIVMALCAFLFVAGGTLFSIFTSVNRLTSVSPPPTPVPTLPPLKVYSTVGKPTISVQLINDVLAYYGSPASGKGQALYDAGVHYGINPAYALAFFLQESNFGTKGVATVTHALGNIRANTGEPQYQGYRLYTTWEAGFEDWYKLIAEKYVGEWHLSTIEQIIPVYAPSEDHNDEAQYISTIKIAIERWRNGFIDV